MNGLTFRILAFIIILVSSTSYANISVLQIHINNSSFKNNTNMFSVHESVAQFTTRFAADYFVGLDSTFANSRDMRIVSAHRFIRLAARLSVFALYCDSDNKRKLSLSVSRFRSRTIAIEKASEDSLGGTVLAYNEFEDARNEESLAFASFDDIDPICAENLAKFKVDTSANATTLKRDLDTAAFGSR